MLMKEPSLSRMEEIITKYISRNSDTAAIIHSKLDNLRKVFSNDYTVSLVPFLASLVLQLALLPDKSLAMLRRGENRRISLTRSQIS